jgi:hypothetical protein
MIELIDNNLSIRFVLLDLYISVLCFVDRCLSSFPFSCGHLGITTMNMILLENCNY